MEILLNQFLHLSRLKFLVACFFICQAAVAGDPGDIYSEWTINAISGIPVPEGIDARITFAEEDRLLAKTGCNNLVSRFNLDGNIIELAMILSTQMMCEDSIMTHERNLAAALEQVHSISVEADTLTVTDKSGNALLSASR
jgi:heat shock protein HslJ